MKYGPSRKELWFRLAVSLAGLAFLVFAVSYRGVKGIAWIEIVGFGGVFLGGSVVWCLWKLRHRPEP